MIRVRQASSQDVPTIQLFRTPTIAALAETLERFGEAAPGTALTIPRASYTPKQRAAGVPCSANQEQMAVLYNMQPGSAAYNMSEPVRLQGNLDEAALEAALALIAKRHETLRTIFVQRDDEVLQAVLPPDDPRAAVKLQRRTLPAHSSSEELQALVAELTGQPYQLFGGGVLARFFLISAGPGTWILLFGMHHIIRYNAPCTHKCVCFVHNLLHTCCVHDRALVIRTGHWLVHVTMLSCAGTECASLLRVQ